MCLERQKNGLFSVRGRFQVSKSGFDGDMRLGVFAGWGGTTQVTSANPLTAAVLGAGPLIFFTAVVFSCIY